MKRLVYLHNYFYLLHKSQQTAVACICNYINQSCNTNCATTIVLVAKEPPPSNCSMFQQQSNIERWQQSTTGKMQHLDNKKPTTEAPKTRYKHC